MNYCKIYDSIIENGIQNFRTRFDPFTGKRLLEKHHIIPKCLGGSDGDDNIVYLTPKEHFTAHLCLIKMCPSERRFVSAAVLMCAKSSRRLSTRNNKCYEWLKAKNRGCWPDELILSSRNNRGDTSLRRRRAIITPDGEISSIGGAAKLYNIDRNAIRYRLNSDNFPEWRYKNDAAEFNRDIIKF